MSWLERIGRLFGPQPTAPVLTQREVDPYSKGIPKASVGNTGGGPWHGSGPVVDEARALRHSAVWACVMLRAGLMSVFPVHAYRKTEAGRERLSTPKILETPTPAGGGVERQMWEFAMMGEISLCLRGNAYAVKLRDFSTRVTGLIMVHPDSVQVRRLTDGRPEYRVNGVVVPLEDMWHIRRHVLPGALVGVSAIAAARTSINLGLEAEQFGAGFFLDGGHPTGLLQSKMPLKDEQAELAKERHDEVTAQGRGVLVLGGDWSFSQIQVSPEDSQFLDTIGANSAVVARFFQVPPELIGAAPAQTGTLTYENREARALDFLAFYMAPAITAWEDSLTRILPRGQYAKLNTDAMLRTDALTQARVNRLRLLNGETIPDELRALADMPPLPDGRGQIWAWPNQTDSNGSGNDPLSGTDTVPGDSSP